VDTGRPPTIKGSTLGSEEALKESEDDPKEIRKKEI
jgi:hypothetical protein